MALASALAAVSQLWDTAAFFVPMAKTYIINGQRWRLRFCRLPKGTDGECDPPDTPGKEIRISDKLSGEAQLDAIIHEVKHARNWHQYDEDYVTKSATEEARLLTGLGYRKVADG